MFKYQCCSKKGIEVIEIVINSPQICVIKKMKPNMQEVTVGKEFSYLKDVCDVQKNK